MERIAGQRNLSYFVPFTGRFQRTTDWLDTAFAFRAASIQSETTEPNDDVVCWICTGKVLTGRCGERIRGGQLSSYEMTSARIHTNSLSRREITRCHRLQ